MSSASIEHLLDRAGELLVDHPGYREGQAYFIALRQMRPELASQILDTDLDPFSVDKRIGPFLEWLAKHW